MPSPYLKLPLSFDAQKLFADNARLKSKTWQEHFNKRAHSGGWMALPLRSVGGGIDTIVVSDMNPSSYADTQYLLECTYLPEVLASFKCPLYSARLMSLAAGEEIRRHTDMDLAYEDGCVRLHIPIQTHPDVTFYINDQPVHFGVGECWYMNANYPHQVINNSPVERIHLVIDCGVNEWLSVLFSDAGYSSVVIPSKYPDPSINDDNALSIVAQLEAMDNETAEAMANQIRAIWQSV